MDAPPPTDANHHTAILDAAVESFGKFGYYDTSLQRVVTEVGPTKAGVLHYMGSKEELLKPALTEEYDRVTGSINTAMVAQERLLIADIWRQMVVVSDRRPMPIHIFSTLSTEAPDLAYPVYNYFVDRERRTVIMTLNTNWAMPEGVNVEHVLRAGFSMMDGPQLRWLYTPGQNPSTTWADYEDALMSLPLWDGYR